MNVAGLYHVDADLKIGSSRFTGERILDFEEEVCRVPETVSHPLDNFDAVVDTLEDGRVHGVNGGSENTSDVFS